MGVLRSCGGNFGFNFWPSLQPPLGAAANPLLLLKEEPKYSILLISPWRTPATHVKTEAATAPGYPIGSSSALMGENSGTSAN